MSRVPKVIDKKGLLNDKQEAFCREYIKDLNGQAAAERAGYTAKSALTQGSKNLALPKIQQRVQELFDKRSKSAEIEATQVIKAFAEIAFADPAEMYDDNGALLPIKEMPLHIRRVIAGIDVHEERDQDGTLFGTTKKVKLWNKNKALEDLGRHLKLFVDRIEVDLKDELGERIAKARARMNEEIDVTPKKLGDGDE